MSTNQATDRIFLRELAVECVIGFLDWERLVKQTVYLDIEVPVDCRRAARSAPTGAGTAALKLTFFSPERSSSVIAV